MDTTGRKGRYIAMLINGIRRKSVATSNWSAESTEKQGDRSKEGTSTPIVKKKKKSRIRLQFWAIEFDELIWANWIDLHIIYSLTLFFAFTIIYRLQGVFG